MAKIKEIPKVKLIIGIMYSEKETFEKVLAILKNKFGDVEESIEYEFNFTDYYNDEFNKKIIKWLGVFKNTIDRELLPEIKLFTNKIEEEFSVEGKRKINIDPGYMTLHNVVLASAKELPHRPYLGKGIFGDVVLVYKNNEFIHSEHTFPDYKTKKVKDFLKKLRKKKD